MSDFLNIFLIIIFIFFCSSCGEYENLELMNQLDRRADSLFRSKRDSLKKRIDTDCTENYDKYYQAALDSIKKVQLSKIENLIKK